MTLWLDSVEGRALQRTALTAFVKCISNQIDTTRSKFWQIVLNQSKLTYYYRTASRVAGLEIARLVGVVSMMRTGCAIVDCPFDSSRRCRECLEGNLGSSVPI